MKTPIEVRKQLISIARRYLDDIVRVYRTDIIKLLVECKELYTNVDIRVNTAKTKRAITVRICSQCTVKNDGCRFKYCDWLTGVIDG